MKFHIDKVLAANFTLSLPLMYRLLQNQVVFMVRYIMTFRIPEDRQDPVQKIIAEYFDGLKRQGPAGMRSQCYTDQNDDTAIVHLKGFRKESIANHHFKSAIFREYIRQLETVNGEKMVFKRLHQHLSFESIY